MVRGLRRSAALCRSSPAAAGLLLHQGRRKVALRWRLRLSWCTLGTRHMEPEAAGKQRHQPSLVLSLVSVRWAGQRPALDVLQGEALGAAQAAEDRALPGLW